MNTTGRFAYTILFECNGTPTTPDDETTNTIVMWISNDGNDTRAIELSRNDLDMWIFTGGIWFDQTPHVTGMRTWLTWNEAITDIINAHTRWVRHQAAQ